MSTKNAGTEDIGCAGCVIAVVWILPLFVGLWYGFNWLVLSAAVSLFKLQTEVTPMNVIFTGVLITVVGGILNKIGGKR